jgi:bifunctional non-homologous end joining protein LigD
VARRRDWRLYTRNGHDLAKRFPSVVEAARWVKVRRFLVDGEVIVCGRDGRSDFGRLRHGGAVDYAALVCAFDLLIVEDEDLRPAPIEARKERLARLLRRAKPGLQMNEHIEELDGASVFAHACKLGYEGIVSKRKGSRYQSGRSPHWLKSKNPASEAVRREAEEDWGRSDRRP